MAGIPIDLMNHNSRIFLYRSLGYYRVLYDAPLMGLLVKQLETNASVINEMTRSQLIDDYFTLAAHSEGLI